MTEEEKAKVLKAVGQELDKLERQHGEGVVRWAVNRRQESRAERRRLREEKKALEKRLAEIGAA